MSDSYENLEPVGDPDVPDWEDDYLDRVSDRLMFNYDLEKDFRVAGEVFDLYGEMVMESEKHFIHPAITFARHEAREHVFTDRVEAVSVADLEALVALGHELAEDWIEANERHFSTEFTFVPIVEHLPENVRSFVADFRDRTLLKYGMHGHYEINLVVVAPAEERLVASEKADVEEAFRLWDPIEKEEPGLWDLFTRRMQI